MSYFQVLENGELLKNYRRFSSMSKETCSPLQWKKISKLSNNVCLLSHTLTSIGNNLYIHGGIKTKSSKIPTNEFYKVDLKNMTVENLTDDRSPHLSQHVSVVFDNRYIILIGGWNGHDRLYKIFVYDSNDAKWLPEPSVTGFHERTGLSGHTANICLKNSGNPEIIVIGREGSLRTQRKYGNIWKLVGNHDLSEFQYGDIHIGMDSRSNHCVVAIRSHLYVIGGRDDSFLDPKLIKNMVNDRFSKEVQKCFNNLPQYNLHVCPIGGRRKAARRNHCCIACSSGFAVLGGQTFMSGSDVAHKAGFLYDVTNNHYYFLGSLNIARANGACAVSESGDAFYHGGFNEHGDMCGDFLKLELVS